MPNTIGQFDFQLIGGKEMKAVSAVIFVLKKWHAYGKYLVISGNLANEKDIDEHINHLKADLDAVGRRAKNALRNSN